MQINVIEDKIAKNEMNAAQVFTQMKQHIQSRNTVIDECLDAINSCELVAPDIMRIRLYEALGAIVSLKVKET